MGDGAFFHRPNAPETAGKYPQSPRRPITKAPASTGHRSRRRGLLKIVVSPVRELVARQLRLARTDRIGPNIAATSKASA